MCGIFGVFNHSQAAELTYFGLHSLQHRGQESAGICVSDGEQFHTHRGTGLVTEAFGQDQHVQLAGHIGIGHVRYTTAGDSGLLNAQPLVFRYSGGRVAVAHNGNLVNAKRLHNQLERQGSIFQTNSDTEVVPHLIARSGPPIEQAIQDALHVIEGAYALLFMTETQLLAAQDPGAFHPLALGKLDQGWVVASETCALDVCGAEFVREIEPGEMLLIDTEGLHSQTFMEPSPRSICSFEYIYFARPDSEINDISVHNVRKEMGRQICLEVPTEADVVIGVPDSGLAAAIGFAEESGLPYEMGMMKNRYVGRTFIQPNQELRRKGVRMKLSVVRKAVEGKRVILVDDSIVRGTTSGRIVEILKAAGATEVHMRVTSPPIMHPCLYGIDTARRMELISATQTPEEICQKIGADSLHFISVEGMIVATGRKDVSANRGHCLACFDGNYPTPTC
jgi:amidophosphoribosyltransferase|tara:strand:+ start:3191 stop:4540 length:1350 start_codon:yes stop_codon:yes gene_type:complete